MQPGRQEFGVIVLERSGCFPGDLCVPAEWCWSCPLLPLLMLTPQDILHLFVPQPWETSSQALFEVA